MKSMAMLGVWGLLVVWGAPATSFAQRGMGDPTGVAQQAVKPGIVSITGTVRQIVTEPCEQTTGPSYLGAHLILASDDGAELNIHLGPAVRVASIVEKLAKGTRVEVAAFRTDKMPKHHYVAQVIAVDKEVLRLRDDDLRPTWAGAGGRAGRPMGPGGPDAWGRGAGRGPGWGRGGMGGRGYGYGRGMGYGARQGNGPGWGRAFVDEDGDGVCDRREMTRWDQ